MDTTIQARVMLHTYLEEDSKPENWQFCITAGGQNGEHHGAAEVEETVWQYLQQYQGCLLTQMPPFIHQGVTPQTIATFFWKPLQEKLAEQGYHLLSLEVERSDGETYIMRSQSLVPHQQTALVVQPQVALQKSRHGMKQWLCALVILILCGSGIAIWLWHAGGGRPVGQQIWEHLYGGDFSGYNPGFFSLFASPAPLPYGIYTVCLLILKTGNNAYFMVLALLYIVSAIGWMLWTNGKERVVLCAMLAAVWFVSPQMLYVLFVQGNLPLAFCLAFIPYYLYLFYSYLSGRTLGALYGTAFCVLCMILCHPVAATFALAAGLLFLLLYGLMKWEWKKTLALAGALAVGVLLSGFWLLPVLRSGTISWQEESPLDSILDVLSPIIEGRSGTFYIGLAVLGVSLVGALCSNWRRAAGFWTAAIGLVVLVCSRQTLWMAAGMTVLLGLVIASLIRWRPCPKWVLIVCATLLFADGVVSFYGAHPWSDAQHQVTLSLQMQQQWISALGDVAPEDGAYVVQNRKMRINRGQRMEAAFERGHYYYVFDRSLENGAGIVLMEKNKVPPERMDKLMDAATKSGYRYQGEMQDAYVFWQETPEQFGTSAAYRALGIGTSAYYASWLFPNMQEGTSPYPEDYTLEQLEQYEMVYLSGWKVRDGQALERLLIQLQQRGVRIVAEAGTGPALFGVQVQDQTVVGVMPALTGRVQIPSIPVDMVAQGSALQGLEEPWVWGEWNGQQEAVVGTKGPVCFIGMRLTEFTAQWARVEYLPVLQEAFGLEAGQQPQRQILAVSVSTKAGRMTVRAPQPEVVLPVAYAGPVQVIEGQVARVHGLLKMQAETVVLQAAYQWDGIVMTGLGLLLALLSALLIRHRYVPPKETLLLERGKNQNYYTKTG